MNQFLQIGVQALKDGDRLVAADAFDDAGLEGDAALLRDPDLPPVALAGERVFRMTLGPWGRRAGAYDVMVLSPELPRADKDGWVSFDTVQPRRRRYYPSRRDGRLPPWRVARALRAKLAGLCFRYLDWGRCYRHGDRKQTARCQAAQPFRNNDFVACLEGAEATLFLKMFSPEKETAR